ncbi:MAG: hypothetical protein JXQ83_06315 [Candidatus Glassbacteria bacterium]|nr:hypothetical protein [Candidatus Glassbacteria bacterium]
MKNPRGFLGRHRRIVFFIGAGLVIRLLIMPFTFHRYDVIELILAADAFHKFGFDSVNPETLRYIFPPFYYFIYGYLVLPFVNLFCDPFTWLTSEALDQAISPFWAIEHYGQLFRLLFIYKLYNLFCDFAVAILLYRMAGGRSDQRRGTLAVALWMFNPVTLHSVYAHGGWDLLPILLVMLSVRLFQNGHPFRGIVLTGVSAGTKLIPLFLLPLLPLFTAGGLKKKTLVFLCGASVVAAGYTVLLLNTDLGLGFNTLLAASGEMVVSRQFDLVRWLQKGLCVLSMGILLFYAYRHYSQLPPGKEESSSSINGNVLAMLLILFAFVPLGFRHYTWLTPFLILHYLEHKSTLPLIAAHFLLMVLLQVFPQSSIQAGLLLPLLPGYFNQWPAAGSLINEVVGFQSVLSVCYKLFVLTTLVLLLHVLADTYGFRLPWRASLARAYRYFSWAAVLALGILTATGAARRESGIARTLLDYGFNKNPTDFSEPLGREHSVTETFRSLSEEVPAVQVFLETDRPGGEADTVEVRLQSPGCTDAAGKISVEPGAGSGYRQACFADFRPGTGREVRMTVSITSGEDGSRVRVGLLPAEINYVRSEYFNIPRLDSLGRLEYLGVPDNVNYAASTGGIPEHLQVAFNVQKKIPQTAGEVTKAILRRITADRVFLGSYTVLLGLVTLLWLTALCLGRTAPEPPSAGP